MGKDVMITAGDFRQWKDSEVTKMLFRSLLERINDLSSNLIINAGKDSLGDRYTTGQIQGLTESFDWKPELDEDD